MKTRIKYFFNDTWIGGILYIILAFFYFIFIALCFIFGIISLLKEFRIDYLLSKVLSAKSNIFLIKASSVALSLFLTAATMIGTKLLIKQLK